MGALVTPSWAQDGSEILPDQRLEVNGRTRRFRLAVPRHSDAPDTSPLRPVVLALHGVADSPANMADYSGLDETAAREGWVLAYPRAMGARWPYFSTEAQTAEVAFLDALISHLIESRGGDPARVYLTGMSGGGFFVNLAGARLSERIAAVAAHSGGAGVLARDGLHASHKYPVLIAHGQEDRVTPIEVGRALAALYRSEGHATEMLEFPEWGHVWARAFGVNERIAAFFAAHALA